MSVLQSTQEEVRYLKRKALEEESRIIGNALRDQIRQYGVDCVYYKLDTKDWTNFKNIIDQNTILKRAYGYDQNPNYTLSAEMITYADVQQDIFLLNKIGLNPNIDIDFNFDRIDFACALATQCGQLKEYPIQKSQLFVDVPDSSKLSAHPYVIGCTNNPPMYNCGILSGGFQAKIGQYQYEKDVDGNEKDFTPEYTIVCNPFEHTQFKIEFPVNGDLYRSLQYKIQSDKYLETLIYLTYRINKISTGIEEHPYKNVLSGYIHGSVLFYDLNSLGKYIELIHPSVGDIIEIDFPDDKNREKYEITECYDKQLTNDGINPLLHKYIWKCKARRYINSFEDNTPQTDADDRVEEMNRYQNAVDEQVIKQISMYDELSNGITEDAVYGGMDQTLNNYSDTNKDGSKLNPDGFTDSYDKQVPGPYYAKYDFIDDGTAIDLIRFGVGSRLLTNGYDLIFMNKNHEFFSIATNSINVPNQACMFEQNLRWLKATDSEVVFINVEGESTAIAIDIEATQGQLEMCLNSLFDKTLDDGKPLNGNEQNFYKFKGTKTYMWSDGDHLYVKLASNKQLYQIDGQLPSL